MPESGTATAERMLAELAEALPSRGRVYIIPHNYPDPDALASAAGMHLLLAKRFNLKSQILFTGTVSRAENRELLRQFQYSYNLTPQESRPSRNLPAILVDTAPWSGNVTVPDFATPIAVVDHHPIRRRRPADKGLVLDIRAGSGATCTIVHEYLQVSEIPLPRWVATLMAYAIASETLDLSRDSSRRDLQAYVSLLTQANLGNLGRIRHAPLPRGYYATLQEAMDNARVFGRIVWTHLDSVSQPEIVAEVADLLHRLERMTWAYCTAMKGGRLLVSLRSSDPRARCGTLLKEVVGKQGSAGGHHHMAAGVMDLGGLPDEQRVARRIALEQALALRIEKRATPPEKGDAIPVSAQPLVEPRPDEASPDPVPDPSPPEPKPPQA